MSVSTENTSYKLTKIHPIIIKNDNLLLNQYMKGKIINRNKKFSIIISSSPHKNIKALVSQNFVKINKLGKTINLEIKNSHNNLCTINNNFKYKHNNFNEEFNLQKSNFYNRVIKTPNFHKVKKGNIK